MSIPGACLELGGNLEVQDHRLCIKQGDKPSVLNLDVEVHEGDLLAARRKFPCEAHWVNYHLKGLPVVVIGGWVEIVDPYAKADINEAMEESDIHFNDQDTMLFIQDCKEDIYNGGCW